MGRLSLAEQRRVEICRALEDCMIENGTYEGTSIRDIAKKAGMVTSMIHHYFESKDEMLSMLAEMEYTNYENHITEILEANDAESRKKAIYDILKDKASCRILMVLDVLSFSNEFMKTYNTTFTANLLDRIGTWLKSKPGYTGKAEDDALFILSDIEEGIHRSAKTEMPSQIDLISDRISASIHVFLN